MNMLRNEDAVTQSFRTAKGIQTSFFFSVLGPYPSMAPKPEKSESGSISWKYGTECLHGKKYLVRTNFFMGPGPFFSVV